MNAMAAEWFKAPEKSTVGDYEFYKKVISQRNWNTDAEHTFTESAEMRD